LALIGHRETNRLDRTVEQQEEAVALVDLPTVKRGQEVARDAVMTRRQIGSVGITDALDEPGARDKITQQQRADRWYRNVEGGGYGRRHEYEIANRGCGRSKVAQDAQRQVRRHPPRLRSAARARDALKAGSFANINTLIECRAELAATALPDSHAVT
jgi:hypothetical protein